MFAPWRSQNSLRKRKDPITGNSFINMNILSSQGVFFLLGGWNAALSDGMLTLVYQWQTEKHVTTVMLEPVVKTFNSGIYNAYSYKICSIFQGHQQIRIHLFFLEQKEMFQWYWWAM